MDKHRVIIKGGNIVGRGTEDIAIVDGRIIERASSIEATAEDRVIDASGLMVAPAFVDVHVHLREPGYGYKERIATGTMAAARGGYTTVCSMPNLNPVPDCVEGLQAQLDIIERDAKIEVLPYAAITIGRKGEELVDIASLKDKVCAFSDDGSGVQVDGMMERAMTEAVKHDALIAAHCEVEELLKGGYIHDGEYARQHGHKGICSESEWEQVKRDIEIAERLDCRYHVCHISTKETVELVRQAKARGVKVTCETGPHYLIFTDMDLEEDARWKMNPPLRSAEDRAALIEGIKDGTIDMIVTDHAPHSDEEKARIDVVDIISSTPKSLGTGSDISGLRFMIMTEPYSSSVSANQISGRLREYAPDAYTFYIELVDIGFPKVLDMYKKRLKIFKKKCVSVNEVIYEKLPNK